MRAPSISCITIAAGTASQALSITASVTGSEEITARGLSAGPSSALNVAIKAQAALTITGAPTYTSGNGTYVAGTTFVLRVSLNNPATSAKALTVTADVERAGRGRHCKLVGVEDDNGALENAEDIYWLIEDEVDELASLLERNEKLPDYSSKAFARKAEWRVQMKLVPPPMLPEKSRWAKLVPGGRGEVTGNILKGLGASAGKVTATARVLFSPEDFGMMKLDDVLVTVTTTLHGLRSSRWHPRL